MTVLLNRSFLVEHEAEFDLEGIIEVPGIQMNQFFGFIETINKGIAVNVKLVGGFCEVEAAGKEGLDSLE